MVPGSRAEATPSKSSLQQQIKEQSKALEAVVEQYNGVTEQLKANQAKEKQLQADLGPLQQRLSDAQASVGEMATQAYMSGPVDSLTALITSNTTTDLLDELTVIDQFATSRRQEIEGYVNLQKQYNSNQLQLQNVIATENAERTNLATQKKSITGKLNQLYAERKQLYGSATETSGGSHPKAPYLPGRGGKVVDFAYAQLGKPYAWAADGPGSYDCSGLTLAAYRTVGVSLYHKVTVQWTEVSHLSRSELKPGDLVFYSGLGHVAIYIGNSKVIHAPTFGEVVKISPINMESIYGYGRP
jgi:peptidoglycan DL-endopeptidase CwlO